MVYFHSPLGIWHVFLHGINTNIYHSRSMKYRQYAQIPANRRIHLPVWILFFKFKGKECELDLLFACCLMLLCNFSMFCCTLLYVHSSFAIILMGKRVLVALLSLSSLCLVIVVLLILTMPRLCLQFVIVVFPDHTHYFWEWFEIKDLLAKASPTSQRCVLDQDTLLLAKYWFIPGRPMLTILKNCWQGRKESNQTKQCERIVSHTMASKFVNRNIVN